LKPYGVGDYANSILVGQALLLFPLRNEGKRSNL
jgi:hypothetical protein